MAGSTFQPPVHLDPNQDPAQQIAFINQNFQSLASVLETNSFRIIDSGFITIPGGVSSAPGQDTFTAIPIPHGLDYTPSIMGFSTGPIISNFPGGTTKVLYTLLPVNFYTNSLNVNNQLTIGTDAVYIYAYNNVDFLIPTPTIPSWDITYYLINTPIKA